MPKSNNQTILERFSFAEFDADLKASLADKKEKKYSNGIYKILYDTNNAVSDIEKEVLFNEFFADLFDLSNIKWSIKNYQNQENEKIVKLLEKYLLKSDFLLKAWITKFRSGMQGKYGILITKFVTDEIDQNGKNYSRPELTPVRVVYKNTINNKIFEISVSFDDNSFGSKSVYVLQKTYSIIKNVVQVDSSLIDVKNNKKAKINELGKDLSQYIKLENKSFTWDFIPVSILKNDLSENSRCKKVKSKLETLNKYDEIISILPHWEKGAILFNGSPVSPGNNSKQSLDFMKAILLDGFFKWNH
ncbi:hypothetical protein [Spiroplasma endosymbiont of Diplazon laetatorius]|uniref:hypothetical protein n=1 Tax=Spiroplasma endosymbiont of Diplazon laetatorius TaxID=3066322 RepID=UPI0030D087C8